MKNLEKKWIIPFAISVVFFVILVIFSISFLQKDRDSKQIIDETEKDGKKYDFVNGDIVVETGFLRGVDGKSIKFISLENAKKNVSQEEKEKLVETFNLNLTDPVTIVTEGTLDNRQRADEFFNLAIGQEIFVEYNKKTRQLITININKPVANQNAGQVNNK